MKRHVAAAALAALASFTGVARAQSPAEEPIELLPEENPAASSPEAGEESRRLRVFGFADFTYYQPIASDANPWVTYFPKWSTFLVGTLNTYLAADLTSKARSMVELRFLYQPHGNASVGPTGEVVRQDTNALDTAEWGAQVQWGGVQIQRAYLEYEIKPWLVVRGGQWLTPYGIWNVDHGSPVIVGIRRPYLVREQLFPERQTGFQIYGTRSFASALVGYNLTLSNGRGPYDSYYDLDNNKGLGGRVYVDTFTETHVTAGASFYTGQYSDWAERWLPIGDDQLKLERHLKQRFREASFAVDLRIERGPLRYQGEFVWNDRAYDDKARPLADDSQTRIQPDLRRFGGYSMLGYRFEWLSLMPYVLVDYFRAGAGSFPTAPGSLPHVLNYFGGLNLRPNGSLVLKLEALRSTFPGAPANSWGRHSFHSVQFQAAWVF